MYGFQWELPLCGTHRHVAIFLQVDTTMTSSKRTHVDERTEAMGKRSRPPDESDFQTGATGAYPSDVHELIRMNRTPNLTVRG